MLQSCPQKSKEPGTFFYCLIYIFQNESIQKQKGYVTSYRGVSTVPG